MKHLTESLARHAFCEATVADVCNAVIAEIAERPDVATINDAFALITSSSLRCDVREYLYDLARGRTIVRVCSHCGHAKHPQTPVSPEVLAVIVAWEST